MYIYTNIYLIYGKCSLIVSKKYMIYNFITQLSHMKNTLKTLNFEIILKI